MSTGGDTSSRGRDESFAELVKDLSRDVSTLVRQEIELAKAEVTEKGKRAGAGAGLLAGAAVVALAVVGGLMATIILVLDLAMPAWLAALITTLLFAAVAGALAMVGRQRLREAGPPVPERAKESVKEDVRWAKTRATSNDE
jgi:uncharacterized membrane protein YqjE